MREKLIDAFLPDLIALRHALHRQPELSGEEAGTAARIRAFLADCRPDEVVAGLGGHGMAVRQPCRCRRPYPSRRQAARPTASRAARSAPLLRGFRRFHPPNSRCSVRARRRTRPQAPQRRLRFPRCADHHRHPPLPGHRGAPAPLVTVSDEPQGTRPERAGKRGKLTGVLVRSHEPRS